MSTEPTSDKDDLLYMAWVTIANAHEGNWDHATQEWREAAIRWRDEWYATTPPLNPPEREGTP